MTITALTKFQLQYATNPANAAAHKTWGDAMTAAANLGTLAGAALTANEGGRATFADDFFDLATVARVFDGKAIDTASLADHCIEATQLESNAVTTVKILNANVTAAKLASDAVETAKIKDLNVTTGKLAAGVISADAAGRALFATGVFDETTATAAFAAQAITGALLKNATVTDTQLASNAVTTAKITAANVTGAKLEAALCAAPSARSGPGAIAITSPTCLVTTTGTGDALTLADGGFAGQAIDIVHIVDGGTGVITQTTGAKLRADITTITFTSVGDFCRLVWTGTLWTPTLFHGVTIATS